MPDKPNVLFLFTDDQRFDTIAALGNPDIRTPALDGLVAGGTAFTRAYIQGGTSGAVCMPSRAMLHTGRGLFGIEREGQAVPDDHALLGEAFRRAGYRTFGTGKWHNGAGASARSFSQGDRIFFGGMSQHYRVPLHPFDPDGAYPHEAVYHQDKKHSSDLFADAAATFLREADDHAPFFAYVSFTAPHDPRDTHERFHALYDPAALTLPPNLAGEHAFDNGELRIRDEMLAGFPRTEACVRRHLADYYAMISHADAAIGSILAALDAAGRRENTLIVFAGDNGLAVGQHGLMGKQNLYEHSTHVPLLLAGPGIPAGGKCDAFATLSDVFPTLCELCGLDTPAGVEGVSLAPALADPADRPRETVLTAYRHLMRAVRDERWKLIETVAAGRRTTQLFDLPADPYETANLADDPDRGEDLARLRRELNRWRKELGDTRPEHGQRFWDAFDAAG